MASLMALHFSCNFMHFRVGVRNDLLQLSDMVDTWWRGY